MLAPRWRVVVALFTVTSCIATAVSTFGVFLPVLSEAFGWSRGAVSVALSISLVLGGVAAFPVGRIADRRGPRAVLATTGAIGAVGFVLSARIEALWQLYLSYGALVGVGMSSVYVLTAAPVGRGVPARRGLPAGLRRRATLALRHRLVLSRPRLHDGDRAQRVVRARPRPVARGGVARAVGARPRRGLRPAPRGRRRRSLRRRADDARLSTHPARGARRAPDRAAHVDRRRHAARLRPRRLGRRQHLREGGLRRVRAGRARDDHERGRAGLAQRRRARAGARGVRLRRDGLVHAVVRVRRARAHRRLGAVPARQRAARALNCEPQHAGGAAGADRARRA